MGLNVGGILKGALPWIGAAITGGPVGVAAMGLKTLNDKLGTKAKNAQEAEAAFIAATPDQRLALKQEEDNFAKEMATLGFQHAEDMEKIAAADRDSARNREIKTGDSWTPRLIAAGFVIGWFAIQWFLLTHILDKEMVPIIMRTLGTLDMAIGLILGYYFGSSAGSRAKDDTIADAVKS